MWILTESSWPILNLNSRLTLNSPTATQSGHPVKNNKMSPQTASLFVRSIALILVDSSVIAYIKVLAGNPAYSRVNRVLRENNLFSFGSTAQAGRFKAELELPPHTLHRKRMKSRRWIHNFDSIP